MSIQSYSVFRTGDATIDRNLDSIKATLDSLVGAGVVTNAVVQTVTITASKLVRHGLGRPAHWEIINQDGPGGLHEGPLPPGVSAASAIMFVPDGAGGSYTIRFT